MSATRATRFRPADTACEYSHCARRSSQFGGSMLQFPGCLVRRIRERPKHNLCADNAEGRNQGQPERAWRKAKHNGQHQRRDERSYDNNAEERPAAIDLLNGEVLRPRKPDLVPGSSARWAPEGTSASPANRSATKRTTLTDDMMLPALLIEHRERLQRRYPCRENDRVAYVIQIRPRHRRRDSVG